MSAPVLVHLRGAGEAEPAAGHALLGRRVRVIVLEAGAAAATPESVVRTIDAHGVTTFSLLAGAAASRIALGVAAHVPERIAALVLEAPAAIHEERRLPELGAPTLILYGTRDPGTPAVGRRLAAILPNAHLVFVYDAGATIAGDRPDAYAEVVADFLERHDGFVVSRTTTVIHP